MHRPLASRILLTAGFTTPAQRLVARRLWQAVMAQEQVRACACGVRAPVRACACTCVYLRAHGCTVKSFANALSAMIHTLVSVRATPSL
jgi:hypothetical protein